MVSMGIYSELEFDGTRCKNCGRLLHKHYGGKHTRRTYREWDGELVLATMMDVLCANCGGVNEIFWVADMGIFHFLQKSAYR